MSEAGTDELFLLGGLLEILGFLLVFFITPPEFPLVISSLSLGWVLIGGGFFWKFGGRSDLLPTKFGEALFTIAFYFTIFSLIFPFLANFLKFENVIKENMIFAIVFGILLALVGKAIEKQYKPKGPT